MPLVFVTGAGAKARNSIGLVLVGGMTIGTLFTLFIVPSLYVLLAKTHHEGRDETEIESDAADESIPESTPNTPSRRWRASASTANARMNWALGSRPERVSEARSRLASAR